MSVSISILIDAFELGMIFAIMSLGVFLSFRVLNTPDMTVDGSFTTGCAVSAIFTLGMQPYLGLLMSFVAGCIAGAITGLLQTRLKIQPLLAGILTMTALYSINLKIMSGQPNISIFASDNLFTMAKNIFPYEGKLIMLALILVVLTIIIFWFLNTQIGMSLRAVGDNEAMVRASSINSDALKVLGLALANGFVALSGGIFAQYQNFADVSGGVGMLVVGLASIIVGEAFIRNKKVLFQLIAVILGAILYRFIITFALQFGIGASDLNLFSAILVTIAISLPYIRKRKGN